MNPSVVNAISSTQAGGAVQVTPQLPGGVGRFYRHLVQAETTLTADGGASTPTAGTLTVRGRAPGAMGFQDLGTIDLTAPEPALFDGFFVEIEAESTGLDAAHTWTLIIVSGD